MRYPGGKNAGGIYQWIINQIPPHRLYIEPFAGSAAVARMKRPAGRTVLIDADPGALDKLAADVLPPNTIVRRGCGIEWLERHEWGRHEEFVYCDPPYLPSTLKTRQRYAVGMDRRQHQRLLAVLVSIPAAVAISGYRSALYDRMLKGWPRAEFQAMTRGGTMATECLWMNYPLPVELHDYQHLGAIWRQRQDIRRMQRRWATKLAKMSTLQRQALLSVLQAVPGSSGGNAAEVLSGSLAGR